MINKCFYSSSLKITILELSMLFKVGYMVGREKVSNLVKKVLRRKKR